MDANAIQEVFGSAVQGSFSVLVAAYLLIRMEGELKALRTAIENLRHCQTCANSPIVKVKEKE
ncbi:hypothetical protein FACS1894204_11970 [Synergistales bacterium]|nr:hypothetical protein FACS1894204_11970 [Synergistales bacterium]